MTEGSRNGGGGVVGRDGFLRRDPSGFESRAKFVSGRSVRPKALEKAEHSHRIGKEDECEHFDGCLVGYWFGKC
jgi:hypothetical protein